MTAATGSTSTNRSNEGAGIHDDELTPEEIDALECRLLDGIVHGISGPYTIDEVAALVGVDLPPTH
ncbi:hypothetical protein [Nocardiopsis sp. JB363]|uniref:hypothetical protein n=1 Tax=Nocardiopsis sp. JB363 TaxID=1434837 RepID=UPI00097ADEF5|nr:hypothetical protein [Nocardiopsis sp. JB363]SIO87436.1 hypothetical protein BQ8420_16500 [Nocardiopsis sp. JB363]